MPHLLLVDDDDDFRESLGLNLIDEGYEVTSFDNGRDALAYLEHGGGADAMLLDWRMPQLTGIEVLRNLRGRGIALPGDLFDGAFRRHLRRGGARRRRGRFHRQVATPADSRQTPAADHRGRATAPMPSRRDRDVLTLGRLELRFDISRALWAGDTVELTLTEFKILALLAEKAGQDVGYREIYDLVHGKDFVAGHGAEGYRANVRTFIKRIRKKFRDTDPDFDHIHNYAGFGYRWTGPN